MRGGTMYSKRDIVIVEFPFSDLMHTKKRPVLILGEKGSDFIVCAITSNPSVKGVRPVYDDSKLPLESTIKYWQIQTILKSKAKKKAARITKTCFEDVINNINRLFK